MRFERSPYPQTKSSSLISELWDTIIQNPPAILARTVLMQHYIVIGWTSEATDMARELLRLFPECIEAQQLLASLPMAPPTTPRGATNKKTTPQEGIPRTGAERREMEQKFVSDVAEIRSKAQDLLADTEVMHQKAIIDDKDDEVSVWEKQAIKLRAIVEGRITLALESGVPPSARVVAELMETQPEEAVNIAADDLAQVVHWWRRLNSHASGSDLNEDGVRSVLLQRARTMSAALSVSLQSAPATALMHIEHEKLGKKYANDETMYGDGVVDIPRARFWASQDNYAWDLAELVRCLSVTGGVMRNPLSRDMFSTEDVQALIQHPLGRPLAAQQSEQHEYAMGIRPATVAQLEKLSATLLADQAIDQLRSRQALDEFGQHTATLPADEQRALDELRVPATDSVSRLPFDCSIGEIVRDAIANRTCMHKAGDLVGQAARYLKRMKS